MILSQDIRRRVSTRFSSLGGGARLQRSAARVAFELIIVFVGVWAALWVESQQDARERTERAFRIVEAIGAEVEEVAGWYDGWRDSVETAWQAWQSSVARGERPAPFYVRMVGAERAPTIGWDAALQAGLFDVFDPELVFQIGNTYHEWSGVGERFSRYHASTEDVILPLLSTPEVAWLPDVDPGPVRTYQTSQGPVSVSAALVPEVAANLVLMQETLAEWNDKMMRIQQLAAMLDEVIAGSERGSTR